MNSHSEQKIRNEIRKSYADIAVGNQSGCGTANCCSAEQPQNNDAIARGLGYSRADVIAAPDGSNLGLGCGNPNGLANLQDGETVLDLGSGAGFDCFIASASVGETGYVIGVDMTPEMISKARSNKAQGDYHNVEFRLGEIENLPVADSSVDVIISNCVINLATDKKRVMQEAFRVLKPGGRFTVSDMVAVKNIPQEISDDVANYTGCVAGAEMHTKLIEMMEQAGFQDIEVTTKDGVDISGAGPFNNPVISANIIAKKPR